MTRKILVRIGNEDHGEWFRLDNIPAETTTDTAVYRSAKLSYTDKVVEVHLPMVFK